MINPGLNNIKDATEICERKVCRKKSSEYLNTSLMNPLYNCHKQQLGTISWSLGAWCGKQISARYHSFSLVLPTFTYWHTKMWFSISRYTELPIYEITYAIFWYYIYRQILLNIAFLKVLIYLSSPNIFRLVKYSARAHCLIFRHRASCILGQAFRYSPENDFYIFNQQIYFTIW